MFANLRLRQRILLGCMIPMVVLAGCMGIIYYYIEQADQALAQLENYRAQEDGAHDISLAVLGIQRAVRGYLLLRDQTNRRSFDEDEAALQRQDNLVRMVRDPQQLEILRRLLDTTTEFSRHNRRLIELMESGRQAEAIARFRDDEILTRARAESRQLADRFLQGAKELRLQHQD
ncbi:MAG: hypothetical protein ACM3VY_00180, partial [Candidatus Bathyarchaeota archaeon]